MFRPKKHASLCVLAMSALLSGSLGVLALHADPPTAKSAAGSLQLEDAVSMALQTNPELAALRQQHGIAAAAVVIARTYPFNPVWTNKLFADNGPEAAGITNRLAMEQRVSIDVEVRGQGRYRREAACHALSRTDWEIAHQEELLALRVIRAFNSVLYYQGKLRLGQETIHLNEQTVEQVGKLVKAETLAPPDLILARSEVQSTRALLASARDMQLRAQQELRRALGATEGTFQVAGALDVAILPTDAEALVQTAVERRPDLHARQEAVSEADARVRLAVADRFGNPNIGPDYEYNETRVNFIGAQLTVPLPVFNTHRGEILQREAERTRAALDLRSTETIIRQDVVSALERLQTTRAWADVYQKQTIPELKASLKDMETLLGQAGAPVLSVIDIRRKLLRAEDSYLDVLFALSQARTDLAAAVGDPGLAIAPERDPPDHAPAPALPDMKLNRAH
jgi:cobalt-zinc-cadmium efflux system outer membrane protein